MKNSQIPDDRLREILAVNLNRLMENHISLTTNEALEKKSGVGRSTIQRIRNRETSPRLDNVASLAEALGVSLAEMLSDSEGSESESDRFAMHLDELTHLMSSFSRLPSHARLEALDFMEQLYQTEQSGDFAGRGPSNDESKIRPR